MALTFTEASTLGEPWKIEVRKSGLLMGRIVKNQFGKYQFYKGSDTLAVHPLVENVDLEQLKDWLIQNY